MTRRQHARDTYDGKEDEEEEEDNARVTLVNGAHSSRNPLATSLPDFVDDANASRLMDAIHKLPGRFRNASFNTTRTTVRGNEIVVRVAGLNGITISEWNRYIKPSYLAGGHFSFDGVCIHIPFRKERNRKRCLRILWGSILACTIALVFFFVLYLVRKA